MSAVFVAPLSTYFLLIVNAFESTVGQDFVFGFINNWFGDGKLLAVVSNANDQPTNITITSSYSTFRTIYVVVQPNFIQTVMTYTIMQCITFTKCSTSNT
jgi:hypothetical protein